MTRQRRPQILALAALAASVLACDPPPPVSGVASASASASAAAPSPAAAPAPGAPERWTEIASDTAPLLQSLTEEFPPPIVVRRGELVRVGKSVKESSWKGPLDDVPSERSGMVFTAQLTPAGASDFAFQADLGGEVPITPSKALCAALAKRAPFELTSCEASLRRARTADGTIVSYHPCMIGPCPVALEREDRLGAIAVQNLTAAHFLTGKKRSVLVAETRFAKAEGKRTTSSVVVIALDGADPARAEEWSGDDIDATRDDHVVSRVVKVAVSRGEVRLTGKVEEHGEGGKLLSEKPVSETHPLPALD